MSTTLGGLDGADPDRVGPYRLLGRLGAGGMGTVYLGTGKRGLVAIKVVHPWLADDGEFRVRFAREVTLGRRVAGRWTAAVVDADPDAPQPWLASEYVHGVPLEHALEAAGPLPALSVHVLAADLARALAAVHDAGLVHRDLKPGNVILTADRPYLIDFGISRALDGTRLTGTDVVVGTPAFMSPEQAAGEEPRTASDIFSLGSVLVCAASGTGPFGEGSPLAVMRRIRTAEPDLGALVPPVREVVAECLRGDPATRPTARELAQRLEPTPEIPRHGWLPPAVTALVPALPGAAPPAAGSTAVPAPDAVTVTVPSVPRPAELPSSTPTRTRLSRRGILLGAGAVAVVTGLGAGIGLALRPQTNPAGPVPPPTVPDRPTWSTRVDGAVRALALGDGFVCVAGLGGQLHVLDRDTGQVRWSHTLRAQVLAPPAVVGGRIAVADSDSLYVLDAARGTLLWESEFTDLPQAAGDLLVASRYEGNSRYALVALDPAGGQVRWSAPALSASSTTTSPIAVGDGAAYAVLGAAVTAVELGTGQHRWQVGTGLDEFTASRLMVTGPVDGLVVLTVPSGTHGDGEFIALDAATGAVRWRRAPKYGVLTPPVVDGGIVVFEMAGGTIVGWDLATGDDRWTREGLTSDGWGAIKTLMAAAGGTSYFGGENRVYGDDGHSVVDAAGEPTMLAQLFALDSATGETRWHIAVRATYHVRSPLVADHGLAVLGTEDGTIHAIRT